MDMRITIKQGLQKQINKIKNTKVSVSFHFLSVEEAITKVNAENVIRQYLYNILYLILHLQAFVVINTASILEEN